MIDGWVCVCMWSDSILTRLSLCVCVCTSLIQAGRVMKEKRASPEASTFVRCYYFTIGVQVHSGWKQGRSHTERFAHVWGPSAKKPTRDKGEDIGPSVVWRWGAVGGGGGLPVTRGAVCVVLRCVVQLSTLTLYTHWAQHNECLMTLADTVCCSLSQPTYTGTQNGQCSPHKHPHLY